MMYPGHHFTSPSYTYPLVTRPDGKKVCWNCGRFRSPARNCGYCEKRKFDKDFHRFTPGDAWQAVQVGLRKSDMIDFTRQYAPCPA